jgi:hypothetical protein
MIFRPVDGNSGIVAQTTVASEEARRLVSRGGYGVWKKRKAITACIAHRAPDISALSLHPPKKVFVAAADARNGGR